MRGVRDMCIRVAKSVLGLLGVCAHVFGYVEKVDDALFREAYEGAPIWGEEFAGTSGSGSTPANARPYIEFLENFIREHDIHSVVDVGCGDWQFSKLLNWEGIDYLGVDIVASVIKANQEKYGASNIHFFKADGTTVRLPEADLLLCKDVLQHLPNKNIAFFLKTLSKYKYCLLTNDVDPRTLSSKNEDIPAGHYRVLDLTAAPFNLKAEKVFRYRSANEVKQILLISKK